MLQRNSKSIWKKKKRFKETCLPFCIWLVGWTKDPLSLGGFSLSPYAPIWCLFEALSARLLCLIHLGIKSTSANTKIINDKTPTIDIQTTLLVVKNFFFRPEFDASDEDGPSACFAGVLPEDGVPVPGPGSSDGDGGGINGDVGGGSGAMVELNGFPSFLHGKYQS